MPRSRECNGKAEVSRHHMGPTAHNGETRIWPGHQNLTSWSPFVHIPFARKYQRRGQTVLAHHGLQADRPFEAALIAAGKRSTEICSFDTDSRSRRRGFPSSH